MPTNPAQRLHDLLREARAAHGNTVTIGKMWSVALGLPDDEDQALLLTGLAAVTALPQEIEARLQADPALDAELFIEPWWEPVGQAFHALGNLGDPSTHFVNHLNEVAMLGLRHAAHAIRITGASVRQPDEAHARELLEALGDVETSLLDANLDPELVEYLLGHVDDMRRSLRLLRVNGIEGVRSAVAGTVGETVMRHAEGKAVPDPDSAVGKKWSTILTQMGAFVGFSNGAIELG